MLTKKIFFSVLLVFVWLGFGMLQDALKIDVNYLLDKSSVISGYSNLDVKERQLQIESLSGKNDYNYYKSHRNFDFFFFLSQRELNVLKWIATPFYMLIHFLFGILLFRINGVKLGRVLVLIYVSGFSASLLTYAFGVGVGIDMYALSRRVVGFLQSILPTLFVVLYYLIEKKNGHIKE